MTEATAASPHKKPRIRRNTKLGTILATLAAGGSLNRFQAEDLGDHCLHSSVSDLEKRYGLPVARKTEQCQSRWGHKVTVSRYWLEPEARERARDLLGEGETHG